MSPAQFVISKFGGLTGTARAVDVPVTTVQGWKERGGIPTDYWKRLIAAAETAGDAIALEDFLTDHPDADASKPEAA